MSTIIIFPLAILIAVIALLYASVGLAGGSGYLAVMALFGVAPEVMKPTALALNILVATIAFVQFYRAGCFSWSMFWPFALTSVPFSFVGGSLVLSSSLYKPVVGLILLYAAYWLFRSGESSAQHTARTFRVWLALFAGIGIGLLSGLTGVGGGILLSPLLLFMGWAELRLTSGVSAAFTLANSIAGLLGHLSSVAALPASIPVLAAAAVVGGWTGAEYGSKRLGNVTLKRVLAAVLAVAGAKMIFV